MTGQERVKKAIYHQEPDRIPLDIGGSRVTGIHTDAYRLFRAAYKLPQVEPEILNPVQVSASGMDTAELKREFGDSLVFHGGGIDSQYTLPYGKVEEVRDEVKRRIDELAPGGGFIFTPVHSIQKSVPAENFIAMIESFHMNEKY